MSAASRSTGEATICFTMFWALSNAETSTGVEQRPIVSTAVAVPSPDCCLLVPLSEFAFSLWIWDGFGTVGLQKSKWMTAVCFQIMSTNTLPLLAKFRLAVTTAQRNSHANYVSKSTWTGLPLPNNPKQNVTTKCKYYLSIISKSSKQRIT